jgi:DNA-binding LacI/PurR family transcriptional regulator
MTNSVNYYMRCTFGAVERARESGYDLTLHASGPDAGSAQARPRVDGIVIIDPLPTDATAARLAAGRAPVVTGERSLAPGPYRKAWCVSPTKW